MEYSDDLIRAVADEALLEWEVPVDKVELVSRTENVVFRVDSGDGQAYALRVHRPGYHTLAELESESVWTAALNDAGVGAPVAEQTRTGGHYVAVGVPGTSEVRHVGLIPWFAGAPLNEMIESATDESSRSAYFEQLGQLMATMHEQAADWQPPAAFKRHSLDADGFIGETPFWGRFWDVPELTSKQRETLIQGRHVLRARLSEYGKRPGTYSMIHADLRSTNILVSSGSVHVIDFDDAGFGWHLYDMAVALFDYMMNPDYESIQDAFISGYRSKREFPDEDIALLPQFQLTRALAGLGWLHDRPEIEMYQFMPMAIDLACRRVEEFLEDS